MLDQVDLASIAARERVTRHDVKARIEEFNALAGHEHIHKGMTSPRPHRERRAAADPRRRWSWSATGWSPRWPGWRGWPPSTPTLVMAGRSHNVPAQATTLGKRFAIGRRGAADRATSGSRTCSPATRCAASRARSAPPQDMLDLLAATPARLAELERRVAEHLGFARVLDQRRPGLPALAGLRRASPRWCRLAAAPVVAGHHDPADGRPRAGHRGLQAGPGRLLGDAAQDEHPLLRAGQRPRGDPPRATLSMVGELAGDQWNEGDVSCSVVRRVALPDAFFAVDGLFETFLTVLDEFGAYPAVIDRELDRYLPFLATTKVLMAAVRRGRRPGGRARGDQGARGRGGAGHAGEGRGRATTCSTGWPPTTGCGLTRAEHRRPGRRPHRLRRRRRRPRWQSVTAGSPRWSSPPRSRHLHPTPHPLTRPLPAPRSPR